MNLRGSDLLTNVFFCLKDWYVLHFLRKGTEAHTVVPILTGFYVNLALDKVI